MINLKNQIQLLLLKIPFIKIRIPKKNNKHAPIIIITDKILIKIKFKDLKKIVGPKNININEYNRRFTPFAIFLLSIMIIEFNFIAI